MDAWWADHASKYNDPEWIKWVEKFNELVIAKTKEVTEEHLNVVDGIKVFGMASSSGPTRASSLKLLGYKEDVPSGSDQFTFMLGHIVEIMALATLHMCGYPLLDTQKVAIVYSGEQAVQKSTSDALVKILGEPTLVSVKSVAYKMSGQQKGKWIRRGFPELPFEGVRKSKPNAYAQIQQEMFGSGIKQGLFLFVSKDIVKAFENDPYLGKDGNGSLVFYTEMVHPEPDIQARITSVMANQMDMVYGKHEAGPCLYLRSDTYEYVELRKAEIQPSNIWGGKNKEITGTFNPCGGCRLVSACRKEA